MLCVVSSGFELRFVTVEHERPEQPWVLVLTGTPAAVGNAREAAAVSR